MTAISSSVSAPGSRARIRDGVPSPSPRGGTQPDVLSGDRMGRNARHGEQPDLDKSRAIRAESMSS